MEDRPVQLEQVVSTSALLGYLNFSDGRPDPRWQKQLNDAYAFLAGHGEPEPWQALLRMAVGQPAHACTKATAPLSAT